jgi:hypothetical protein
MTLERKRERERERCDFAASAKISKREREVGVSKLQKKRGRPCSPDSRGL